MMGRPFAVAALLLASVVPAAAQQSVKLEFASGKVTLIAQNAPVRAILAEWARVGGATIVNGDRVAGPAVSLELRDVPERQAIDVVLRGVAGYMIAPRPAGAAGASAFNRIVVLPTSSAPPPPPPTAVTRQPVRPPIVPRFPPPAAEPPAGIEGEPGIPTEEPQEGEPAPDQVARPIERRTPIRPPIVVGPRGVVTADQVPGDEQTEPSAGEGSDDVPAVTTTPSNPFGIPAGSSARPGVIAPQPNGTQRPGTTRVQ
jgi:hypothetical protein